MTNIITTYQTTNNFYLYCIQGAVDQKGYDAIDIEVQKTKQLLDDGKFQDAVHQWKITGYVIMEHTAHVNFYNILTPVRGKGITEGKGNYS